MGEKDCYQVQALSSSCKRGNESETKNFIQELADQEGGRLEPQNNQVVGTWLPGTFMDQRWAGGGLGASGVRKQSKKTIQSLQMSPRKPQAGEHVSFTSS